MVKGFTYIWLILLAAIATYIVANTSKDMTRDAKTNENIFKPAIKFIDSFKLVYKRLPLKTEFDNWQRNTSSTFGSQTGNVCKDTFTDPFVESLRYQYLRVKNDFKYNGTAFKLQNIDFCRHYALTQWNGNEWIYYLSWNKNYSNHYSWLESITLFMFYILIGLLPLLWKKFKVSRQTAPNTRIQAIGAGR